MRYTYLIIDSLIILVPLLYSFDPRIRYYRCFPALGLSMLVVGIPYLAWDMLVTRWGEWSFNARYVIGIDVVNLPVEEILFFVTVPYSCLFIYESIAYYSSNRRLKLPRALFVAAGIALLGVSVPLSQQGYTVKALVSCAAFLFCALLFKREFIMGTRYWVWLAICYIPFLVLNSVLTALPVVEYDPRAILGPRIGTIPLEDFLYNFSMLSFYGWFYVLFKDWLRLRQYNATRYGTDAGQRPLLTANEGAAER